jgi:rod shape-determining protein MreC
MKKSEQLLLLILFLLTLAIILFNQSSLVLFFKNNVYKVMRPAEIIFSGWKRNVSFWQDAIFNIRDLKEKNEKLVQDNMELNGKIARLSDLENENSLLKEALNLKNKSTAVVIAKVIGRDFQNNRSFIIDKGENDGIKTGMAVILKGNILVGLVVETYSNSSKVQTMLDTQSKIAVSTITTKTSGLVRGLGSDVIFDLIAKNEKPDLEELVVSSGVDGVWPRGLLIGKIKKVDTNENQVFNTADIELMTDFSGINDVLVMTEK